MSSADAARLTALGQQGTGSQESDDDEAPGAPAATVYENQSGDIVDTLKGMLEKAQSQLDNARNKETSNVHVFEKLKQSLEDEIRFATKDMSEAKAGAQGDLTVTEKDLATDKEAKDDLHASC